MFKKEHKLSLLFCTLNFAWGQHNTMLMTGWEKMFKSFLTMHFPHLLFFYLVTAKSMALPAVVDFRDRLEPVLLFSSPGVE
jgi:hypothetical protein